MYYVYEVLTEIEKLLDGNGEYDIFVAKNLNNELKEIKKFVENGKFSDYTDHKYSNYKYLKGK